MTRLLLAASAFFSVIFLFSCNQKPDEKVNKLALAPAAASDSLDASMYLLYIRIDTANALDTLVNLPGTQKLVFKCYFDTTGKLTLAAYGGTSGNASFDIMDVPVMKTVPDSGVIHRNLGRNIYIGDLEIDKKQNNYIKALKDYLGSPLRQRYLIFIPKIVPADGHLERNMLMFNIIASPTLPTTQTDYDNLMNMNFQNQNLSAGGSLPVNPCPPRCN